MTIKYLDRPELADLYVDRIGNVESDLQTIRIEFAVARTRIERGPGEQRQQTTVICPVSRVAISIEAARELHNALHQLIQRADEEPFPYAADPPSTKQ